MLSVPPLPPCAGKGSDEVVGELAAELEASLPPLLEREEALAGLFDRTAAGQLNSLSVVLGQEMDRFNRLSRTMATSLRELQKALKGLVVMSGELEAMYNSMLINQVPEMWARYAYPSLKPLSSWVKDYMQRIDFMRGWLTAGVPKCFWLPGFFFPQASKRNGARPAAHHPARMRAGAPLPRCTHACLYASMPLVVRAHHTTPVHGASISYPCSLLLVHMP